MDFAPTAADAIAEIAVGTAAIDPAGAKATVDAIASAKRIALYGVGREGLMIKAFAMRLYHLGLDAHVVGDMTTPPLGVGDLLVVSAGPGMFSTVAGLVGVAQAGEIVALGRMDKIRTGDMLSSGAEVETGGLGDRVRQRDPPPRRSEVD